MAETEIVNNSETKRGLGSGAGRAKGTPNKSTVRAREAIAKLVDDNSERLQGWLDDIAATDGPLAAWKCVMDVVEYHIPKLQRTELTGPDNGPIQHEATVTHKILSLMTTEQLQAIEAEEKPDGSNT